MKEKWSKKLDKPRNLLRQYEEIRVQLRDCKNTSQKTELLKKKELLKAEVEIEYEKLIAQAEGINPYQIEFDIDERYCQESKLNDDIDKKYNLAILEKKIISLSFYRNNAKDCRKMYRGSVLSSLNWIHFDTFSYQKAKMLNYSTLTSINEISSRDITKRFSDYELAHIDSTGFTEEEIEGYRYSQETEESDFQRIRNEKNIKKAQVQHFRENVASRFIGNNKFNKSNRYKIDGMSGKFQDIYGTTNIEDNDVSIQIIRLPNAPQKAVLYDDKGILMNHGKKKTEHETKNLIYRIAKKLKIMEVNHIDTVVTPQKKNVSYPGLRKDGLFEFVNKETKFYTPQDFPPTSVLSPSAHSPQADFPLLREEGKVRERKGEEFFAHSNIHNGPTYEIVNISVYKHRAKSEEHRVESIEQDLRYKMKDTGYTMQDSRDALSELPNISNETEGISKYTIPTMTMKQYYLKMLDDRMQDTGYKIHDAGYRIQDRGEKMQDASTNIPFSGKGPISENSMHYVLSPMLIEKEPQFNVIMEKLFSLSPSFEDNKVGNNVSLISKDQISKNINEKRVYPTISSTVTSDKMHLTNKNDNKYVRTNEHLESDFVLLSLFNNRDKTTSSYAEGRKEQPVVKIDRQNKSIPVQKASPQRGEDKDISFQETGVFAKSTVRELFTNFCREYTRKKKMHDM